jgi:hypothetical protein
MRAPLKSAVPEKKSRPREALLFPTLRWMDGAGLRKEEEEESMVDGAGAKEGGKAGRPKDRSVISRGGRGNQLVVVVVVLLWMSLLVLPAAALSKPSSVTGTGGL